jgi:AP endonuclease family 2 C terminus.
VAASHGLAITELSTHLQGQLVAVHPAYNEAFDVVRAARGQGQAEGASDWAVDQMMKAAQASRRLGLTGSVSFTGALAWPFLYPWPQRPPGLIETAFDELARRWRPILDAYEEPVSTSATRSIRARMSATALPSRCSMSAPAITSVARSTTIPRTSFYSNSITWPLSTSMPSAFAPSTSRTPSSIRPAGRASIRASSPGSIAPAAFARSATGRSTSRRSSRGWQQSDSTLGVLEWECCLKNAEDGAREGAAFIRDHVIRVTEQSL